MIILNHNRCLMLAGFSGSMIKSSVGTTHFIIKLGEYTMKKILVTLLLACSLTAPAFADDDLVDGLNVLVTSGDAQTQMMSMVLSMKTIKVHKKKVNMVLCDKAGSLAVKGTDSPVVKAMGASPKDVLKKLIKAGMDVKVCPLYLPSIDKDESVLIEGVKVANPDKVSENLLKEDYHTLTY